MFTNETLDTASLPRFEEAPLTKLNPAYGKILVINLAVVFLILLSGAVLSVVFWEEARSQGWIIFGGVVLFIGLVSVLTGASYRRKGFAFREHDVIYRHGVISTTTMVIPYNRVQHVALHEGWLSRIFGLAKVQVFTAGGHQSDIGIPGIERETAENIKQLLMSKIRKEL